MLLRVSDPVRRCELLERLTLLSPGDQRWEGELRAWADRVPRGDPCRALSSLALREPAPAHRNRLLSDAVDAVTDLANPHDRARVLHSLLPYLRLEPAMAEAAMRVVGTLGRTDRATALGLSGPWLCESEAAHISLAPVTLGGYVLDAIGAMSKHEEIDAYWDQLPDQSAREMLRRTARRPAWP